MNDKSHLSLALCCLLMVIVEVSCRSTGERGSYFPLSVGNEWRFRSSGGVSVIIRVDSCIVVDRSKRYIVGEYIQSDETGIGAAPRLMREIHYVVLGDTAIGRAIVDVGSEIRPPLSERVRMGVEGSTEDGVYQWYRLIAHEGETWHAYGNSFLFPSDFGDYQIELKGVEESIEGQKQRYDHCLHFTTIQRNSSEPGPIDEWLFPGIGLVRRRFIQDSLDFELVECRLAD